VIVKVEGRLLESLPQKRVVGAGEKKREESTCQFKLRNYIIREHSDQTSAVNTRLAGT
jgi:hypothetical protein